MAEEEEREYWEDRMHEVFIPQKLSEEKLKKRTKNIKKFMRHKMQKKYGTCERKKKKTKTSVIADAMISPLGNAFFIFTQKGI